jgi:hypothetical protein
MRAILTEVVAEESAGRRPELPQQQHKCQRAMASWQAGRLIIIIMVKTWRKAEGRSEEGGPSVGCFNNIIN